MRLLAFIEDWLYAIWISFFPPKVKEDDDNPDRGS